MVIPEQGYGPIVLHQNEDGSVQLRDSLTRMWCACGQPAVHYFNGNLPPHQFKCIKCALEDHEGGRDVFKVGDLVEVVKPFFWYREDRFEIGERFVFEAQHVGHNFEAWVKKINEEVFVYRVSDCDSVAARSAEEALKWYKEMTGLSDDEIFSLEQMEIVPLTDKVYDAENYPEMISVQQIIDDHWNGEPFIACSTEW